MTRVRGEEEEVEVEAADRAWVRSRRAARTRCAGCDQSLGQGQGQGQQGS